MKYDLQLMQTILIIVRTKKGRGCMSTLTNTAVSMKTSRMTVKLPEIRSFWGILKQTQGSSKTRRCKGCNSASKKVATKKKKFQVNLRFCIIREVVRKPYSLVLWSRYLDKIKFLYEEMSIQRLRNWEVNHDVHAFVLKKEGGWKQQK